MGPVLGKGKAAPGPMPPAGTVNGIPWICGEEIASMGSRSWEGSLQPGKLEGFLLAPKRSQSWVAETLPTWPEIWEACPLRERQLLLLKGQLISPHPFIKEKNLKGGRPK